MWYVLEIFSSARVIHTWRERSKVSNLLSVKLSRRHLPFLHIDSYGCEEETRRLWNAVAITLPEPSKLTMKKTTTLVLHDVSSPTWTGTNVAANARHKGIQAFIEGFEYNYTGENFYNVKVDKWRNKERLLHEGHPVHVCVYVCAYVCMHGHL